MDQEHQQEVSRLKEVVVLYAPEIEFDLSIDQVAQYAAMTGLTTAKEVTIGIMTKSRYLIQLPPGISPDAFIRAIPSQVWELGYSFYQWSPADDAAINIAQYKVLLDLVGTPPYLSKDSDIARATSSFGLYLGTVEQNTAGDVACWTLAVAVQELERIPQHLVFVAGGLETVVEILPKTWLESPLYNPDDLPKPPEKFTAPPPLSSQRKVDRSTIDNTSLLMLAKQAIEEMCRGRDLDSLPPELKAVLSGPEPEKSREHTQSTPKKVTTDPKPKPPLLNSHPEKEQANDVAGHQTGNQSATLTQQDLLLQRATDPHYSSPACTENPEIPLPQFVLSSTVVSNPAEEPSPNRPRDKEKAKIVDSGDTNNEADSVVQILRRDQADGQHVSHPSTWLNGENYRAQNMIRGEHFGPKPKLQNKQTEAQLQFDPKGYIEITVDFDHCARIAAACGLQTEEIISVLNEDNLARQASRAQTQAETEHNLEGHDPDSGKELSSGSETD